MSDKNQNEHQQQRTTPTYPQEPPPPMINNTEVANLREKLISLRFFFLSGEWI